MNVRDILRSMEPGDSYVFPARAGESLLETQTRASHLAGAVTRLSRFRYRYVTRQHEGRVRVWRISDTGSPIEKGIPIPRAARGLDKNAGSKYGFESLAVGESVRIERPPEYDRRRFSSLVTANVAMRARKHGSRFSTKTQDDDSVIVTRKS